MGDWPKNKEEEALQRVKWSLEHGNGTAKERRSRTEEAWQALRSASKEASESRRNRKKEGESHYQEKRRKKRRKEGGDLDHAVERKGNEEEQKKVDTAFLAAARAGDAELVHTLLSEGLADVTARIRARDEHKYTALHWASLYGHLQVVQCLLRWRGGVRLLGKKTVTGNTALHFACLGKHASVVALLLLYKPDIFAANESGQTPVSLGLRELESIGSKEQSWADADVSRAAADAAAAAAAQWEFSELRNQALPAQQGPAWADWRAYQSAWEAFVTRWKVKGVNAKAQDGGYMAYGDVPWPIPDTGDWELLVGKLGLQGEALRSAVQQERLRWHPDKFQQLFGRHLAGPGGQAIQAGVDKVCQLLNGLASEGVVGAPL